MFDRIDGCEYVFIWRTSEACPIRKSQGKNVCDSGQKMFLKVKHRDKICTFSVHCTLYTVHYNKLSEHSLIGADCRVRDPKSGYEFDLSSLKGKDYSLNAAKYIYYLSICGGLQTNVCTHKKTEGETVSSCQVAGGKHKIAGMKREFLIQCNV